MDANLKKRLQEYVECYQVRLTGKLGDGVHGVVFSAESNVKPNRYAVKMHRYAEPFHRELSVYRVLKEKGITMIRNCHVPICIGYDASALALEMSIVTRPFVLDFAGAYIEDVPEFSDEIWEQWRCDQQERFGADWPSVETIISDLRSFGIHMQDISPSNISFRA